MGIDNRVGSLEEGKDADIAIFKGHPLSIYAIPVFTIVDGIVRFDREKDASDMRLIVDSYQSNEAPVSYQQSYIEEGCLAGMELFYE